MIYFSLRCTLIKFFYYIIFFEHLNKNVEMKEKNYLSPHDITISTQLAPFINIELRNQIIHAFV